MDRTQANDLVDFIQKHSKGLNVSTVNAHRDAPRSQSWHVRAMVSRLVADGTEWWLEYFHSGGEFVQSEWYDQHAPLRLDCLVADSMAESQRKYLCQKVADITKALRDLADRIDRDFSRMDEHTTNTPEAVVTEIQHAILWAVPNLHTEQLHANAAMLTQHRARARAAQEALIAAEYGSKE